MECFVTAKDPDAFRILIERHGPTVLAVCRNVLRQQHDAEDAFQDTFLALATGASTIKQREAIGPWLHQVAFRLARRARFETSQRRVHEGNRNDSRAEYPIGAPDLFLATLLREEVSRLPERHRLPVVLCYLEGKTHQEAAAQLRCPLGTLKARLSRARQTLRVRLSRRGFEAYPQRLMATS
jgi:RNA polymerase sigma factor (sigma-70 family)